MRFLYNLLVSFLVVLAMPIFMTRLIREKGFGQRIRQSCGFLPSDVLARVANKKCIWLHAASVGEIVATSPIVKEIRRELPDSPILVSVVTASGYEMANRIIPEASGIIFFPLDLPWLAMSIVRKIRPRIFLPVETELWPNFLRAIKSCNIPVMMVNGRISDKSVKRYNYLHSILRDMLQSVTKFCMQSKIDAEYIIKLGADPERVVVTGNTKFDQTYTDLTPEGKDVLMRELTITDINHVVLAGSTHKGEENIIFEVLQCLKANFPNIKLVLAPRNIARVEELIAVAKDYGLKAVRRTLLRDNESLRRGNYDIVFIDTIGELGKIYAVGDIIYVGGSLIPHGGHNILEPAAHGKPIIVGPHMFNFKDSYALLSKREACTTVHNSEEFVQAVAGFLSNEPLRREKGEQALAIIKENRGAAQKTVIYLKDLLQNQH